VVCTLCSCYPHALIRAAARLVQVLRVPLARGARAARVLREFGSSTSPETTEIRIWDSSAELRYLVLPERPAGTERLSEAELASWSRAIR
jgi:nitrile hydratase